MPKSALGKGGKPAVLRQLRGGKSEVVLDHGTPRLKPPRIGELGRFSLGQIVAPVRRRRFRMLRPTRCLLVLVLLAGLGAWRPSPAPAQSGGSVVTCESRGSSREQCRIPADVRVELTRHLSDTPCEQGRNWGVSAGYIWVSNGCRAEFTVTGVGYGGGAGGNPGYGNANANPNQLRACQTEADRRMPSYSYNQISVNGESRQGPIAYVRWRAGPATGLCSVHANGRVLSFTTDNGPGGGVNPGVTTQITCESQRTDREQCSVPAGATVRLLKQLSQNTCRLNDTYGQG